jgi:iron complex outermembrane recepter protein
MTVESGIRPRNIRGLCVRVSPLALAIATALTGAFAASAQQGGGLEEIVVTARYREENIQTTPISISAFSGEELELRSIENVEDIGLVIPNAYFRRNASNFGPNNTIGLRGLNQVDFSYAFEPTVGIYIDDVYHSTITGSDMDLVDLERVEVLRGPQGTLFGKNSIGGAIRLISRKPEGDNTGSVAATFGDFDRLDLKAVGDFALVPEKLFVRIVGTTKKQEGYGASLDFTCEMIRRGTPQLAGIGDGLAFGGYGPDNTALFPSPVPGAPPIGDFDTLPDLLPPIAVPVGSAADNAFSLPAARSIAQDGTCELGKLGGTSSEAGRVMLRFLASDKIDINLAVDMSSSLDDPNIDAQLSPINNGNNLAGIPTGGDNLYDSLVVFRKYGIHYASGDTRFLSPTPYTNYATFSDVVNGQTYPRDSIMDTRGASLVVDYAISDNLGAKIILAKRGYDSEWTNDSDRTPFGLTQTHYIQNHDETQAELQFNGSVGASDRLGWTAGLFYFDAESRAYNTTEFEAFHFSGALLNFVANDVYTTENESAFVHVTYDFTERLRVSGGARYTDESKTNRFDHGPELNRSDVPLLFGDSRTDWKVSVDYQLNDRMFLYAQAATGFTSEGATPRIFTVGQLMALKGEELVSNEIGAKLEFLDNRLRLNAAVFASDYDPRIRQTGGVTQCDARENLNPVPYRLGPGGRCPAGTALANTTGLPWFFYDNSPGELNGYEVELTASPVDSLLVNFSLGQNEYENADKDPLSVNYIAPGYLFQPEFNASAGVQWAFNLGGGGILTPRLDAFYQSDRHTGPANARPGIHDVIANVCPQQCLPAYTIFNLRLTYDAPNSDWRLSLAGTNVTDKFYWQQYSAEIGVNGTTGAITPFPAARTGVASAPREYALTIEKRF